MTADDHNNPENYRSLREILSLLPRKKKTYEVIDSELYPILGNARVFTKGEFVTALAEEEVIEGRPVEVLDRPARWNKAGHYVDIHDGNHWRLIFTINRKQDKPSQPWRHRWSPRPRLAGACRR